MTENSRFFARIGFAANPTAKNNVTSQMQRRLLQPGFVRGGNLFEAYVQEECLGELPGWEIPRRKRQGRNDQIQCRIASLYVQRGL